MKSLKRLTIHNIAEFAKEYPVLDSKVVIQRAFFRNLNHSVLSAVGNSDDNVSLAFCNWNDHNDQHSKVDRSTLTGATAAMFARMIHLLHSGNVEFYVFDSMADAAEFVKEETG